MGGKQVHSLAGLEAQYAYVPCCWRSMLDLAWICEARQGLSLTLTRTLTVTCALTLTWILTLTLTWTLTLIKNGCASGFSLHMNHKVRISTCLVGIYKAPDYGLRNTRRWHTELPLWLILRFQVWIHSIQSKLMEFTYSPIAQVSCILAVGVAVCLLFVLCYNELAAPCSSPLAPGIGSRSPQPHEEKGSWK